MSSETDDFYRDNMYNNFGDISINIKDLVDQYQSKTKTTQQITSIADMRNFIDSYPQFRQMSGTCPRRMAQRTLAHCVDHGRHCAQVRCRSTWR